MVGPPFFVVDRGPGGCRCRHLAVAVPPLRPNLKLTPSGLPGLALSDSTLRLVAWLVGVSLLDLGKGIHGLLLVGLMLLLLGLLKARDGALTADRARRASDQK